MPKRDFVGTSNLRHGRENKENQGFTSVDFFIILFSLAIIGFIVTPILETSFQSSSIDKARAEMQKIAARLKPARGPSGHMQLLFADAFASERSLASVKTKDGQEMPTVVGSEGGAGDIGRDPWGDPYHFLLVKSHRSQPPYVVIWSDGPDRKSQTALKSEPVGSLADEVKFNGDDFGIIAYLR